MKTAQGSGVNLLIPVKTFISVFNPIHNRSYCIGFYQIHLAIIKKDFDKFRKLLEAGSDPNLQDTELQTPLHYVTSGNYELKWMQLLFAKKANPNLENRYGQTPLLIAMLRKATLLEAELRMNGAFLSSVFITPVDILLEDEIRNRKKAACHQSQKNRDNYIKFLGGAPLTVPELFSSLIFNEHESSNDIFEPYVEKAFNYYPKIALLMKFIALDAIDSNLKHGKHTRILVCNHSTVSSLFPTTPTARGICTNNNAIYVAGTLDYETFQCSIHEIAHRTMNKVFDQNGAPYTKEMYIETGFKTFIEIMRTNLKIKFQYGYTNQLEQIFFSIFISMYESYREEKLPSEMAARYYETHLVLGRHANDFFSRFCPGLEDVFNVFIEPVIQKKVNELEKLYTDRIIAPTSKVQGPQDKTKDNNLLKINFCVDF